MKRIIIASIAIMMSLGVSSQTNVPQVDDVESLSLIPSMVTTDSKVRVELFDENKEDSLSIFSIYKENFVLERRVRVKRTVSRIYHVEMKTNDGRWITEYSDTLNWDPIYPSICDVDKNSCFSANCTQILFNNDDNYEYIVPKFRYEENIEELDRDNDGIVDYRTIEKKPIFIGLEVLSEDCSTVMSFDFERESDTSVLSIVIYLWGGKKYLSISYVNEGRMSIYEIDGETSRVNKVVSENYMHLFPPIAKKKSFVSVELDVETKKQGGVLQIISSNGRFVYTKHVDPGFDSIQIPTQHLNSGVYVVIFKPQGKEVETSKLIIQ